MKTYTKKELIIKRFEKLMSAIEDGYMLAKYLYENVANEANIFKDEQKQHDYSVYARGRLTAITNLMIKANRICLDKFEDDLKTEDLA